MAEIVLDKSRTALLIADFYEAMMTTIPHAVDRGVVERTVALQKAARDAGVMVCYCATVFRPGYPEIGSRNKTFGQRKASGQPAVFDPLDVIHPAVAPAEGEVAVGKHRVNALYGTGLDVALRANDINTLVILGYATSGVVLSTVRYASDLDYNLYVVEDCCSDSDPEVHDFLTGRLFPRQSEVVQSADVIAALAG
ncbi:Isochorismatase family protein YecD [Geodia barretti]|uniref:Isochorismatase family protein YecD n=1 Tax=Geodia barretti TaxID=519541 RepID=A0AA35R7T2_GEOBA|nr:Isochorismatase family protein YecD [Geodia barretti]